MSEQREEFFRRAMMYFNLFKDARTEKSRMHYLDFYVFWRTCFEIGKSEALRLDLLC
jgi:hypothetical protein